MWIATQLDSLLPYGNMGKRQHAVNISLPLPSRTPAGDAVSRLVIQIFQLNGRLLAAGDELARPAGQTSARWQVLAAADHAPMTVAQIARAMGLARQSVQRVADLLATERLVAYVDNPRHLRAKLIQLRPEGLKALRAIQQAQCMWADDLGTEVGEVHLKRASAALDALSRALLRRKGEMK